MSFSLTGLSFLFGAVSIGMLVFRFFQYWREEKNTTSKLFFWFTAMFPIFMLLVAVGSLFFADNAQILKLTVVLATLFQGIACSIIGYMIIYIKFPSVSPWWGAIPIFLLGMFATFSSIFLSYSPRLEPDGGINWDIPLSLGITRSILFLITFLPLILILIQQIRGSSDAFVRTKAFGLSIVLIFGIIMGFLDFFLETVLGLSAISSAIVLIFLSIIVFFIIFITQKAPKKQKNESSTPSSPQISW